MDLEAQKRETQREAQRTGEGRRKTDGSAGAGQGSRAPGRTAGGAASAPAAQAPPLSPGWPRFAAVPLGGWAGLVFFVFFNSLLVVCLLQLTWKQ